MLSACLSVNWSSCHATSWKIICKVSDLFRLFKEGGIKHWAGHNDYAVVISFLINIEEPVLQPTSRRFRSALLILWLENKSLGRINNVFILGPDRKLLFPVSSLHREKRL